MYVLILIVICGVAQNFAITCNYFEHWWWGYCCELDQVSYLTEGEAFVIEGQHLKEYTDDDVIMIFASFSNISYVPKEILPKFVNLKSLLFSQLGIENIDGVFDEGCNNIETVTFYRNKLKKINSRAFEKCVNLNSLDLGDNQITAIPSDAFKGLAVLETLVIDNNPITTLHPEIFTNLICLKFLFMSNLEVSELNSNLFTTLKKLERFHFGAISPYNITKIQTGTFKSLPDLQSLQIVNNNQEAMVIEELAFEDLEKLERLVIAGSAIEELKMNSFSGLQNLLWFSIEDNKVSEIERNFFTLFPKLEEFNTNLNPCGNQSYYLESGYDDEFMQDFEDCFSRWDESHVTTITIPSTTTAVTSTTEVPDNTTLGASTVIPSMLMVVALCAFYIKNLLL